ncbi:MAG: GNAT family N-acetyltransferase [Ruminococcus sp.]|nr:GNAT family N-acetyltransferase [Ruminococcus sp.]
MSTEITRISANDDIFERPDFLEDRLVFNYIDNARQDESTEFYSDEKHVIVCRKKDNKSVWIWTDNETSTNVDIVANIAKVVKEFNVQGLEFFTKPQIAQIFSDMYALVSNELDYQVKSEYSLGTYVFSPKSTLQNDDITVLKYNKKFFDKLLGFYMELKDEFHWSEEKAERMVKKFTKLNVYLLLKNSEIISVCVISNDTDNCSSIRSVATKQSQRNNGYGTLVTNISSVMHQKADTTLMLYANNGNRSAVSTFKKAGFELIGNVHLIKS